MKTRLFAMGLCALAMGSINGWADAQGRDKTTIHALPWGQPVPRPLHSAALSYRQRTLQHCIRTRLAQTQRVEELPVDGATQRCTDTLTARGLPPPVLARLER